ncbi:STAS domain-containing protein [Evansella sp. LMS18]|uniref:STAS domain-containing protein n=1 Tax=Evansella sp. LMS18 TaxID=2924033 RepID=UPI0020D172F6|nr:STAS domain-containing protein [Evansella sp. LMS18]UTR11483.1 STAS domain-containing protein [Evansella sp. LMS18]
MQTALNHLPLSAVVIDRNFKILDSTSEAAALLGKADTFLSAVEEGSRDKVKRWVKPEEEKVTLEANLVTEQGEVIPVELAVGWGNDLYGEIIIFRKDRSIDEVSGQLANLRERLSETNFELLGEKEKLEEALQENNRLSAPYIQITDGVALIPLYGDLNEDKMNVIQNNVLASSKEQSTETLLFDFTAVGSIEASGVRMLKRMFASLCYMGNEVLITGVKPDQAKRLHELDIKLHIEFIHSLKAAVRKFYE